MNEADPRGPCRPILSVSGLVILSLIFLCGVDQVKAHSQSTTNSNNINKKNSGGVARRTTMPYFMDAIGNIDAAGALGLQGDCGFT